MAEDSDAVVVFENGDRLIRRVWHEGRWFFSVVDVIGVLTDSEAPRRYWSDLKRKLRAEGFESYEKIVQLKMRSLDGKSYATDASDAQTMLRIVQSIPSPKAEPVKQWLARVGTERLEEVAEQDILAGMSEDLRRLYLRDELVERNKQLAATAQNAGVITSRDFAVFQDHGYMGLYNGERARDIHARKGLKPRQHILDHMGHEELAANWFRATQAEAKIRREGITGKVEANHTHYDVGREVRATIERLGGTMPENLLTPPDSIEQVRQREQKRIESERQPPLFD